MLKRLIILFLLYPAITFAQFTDDFEDGDISNWTESTTGHWAASGVSPLSGAFSLHHIFDNTEAGKDQISIALPVIDLSADSTIWRFKIKYNYNPSDGNNWSAFLVSDVDASQMIPGESINGYTLGVNYTGSDDILKFQKIIAGIAMPIITTTLNWDDDTSPSDIIALEIIRTKTGIWEVFYNVDGDFNNLTSIGTGIDETYLMINYFGFYYDYTSSADQLLWIDDIEITGEVYVDNDPPLVDSVYVQSYKSLKIEFNEKIDSTVAVNPLNFSVDGDIGNPDSVVVDNSHTMAELFFNQKFADNQLYEINIQNIEDLNGNEIKDTSINFMYEYIKPLSLEVISSNELQIQFSRKVDIISAEDPSNYSLDNGAGNPNLVEVLTDDSTKVQIQFGADFINETYYNLTIQNVADRNLDSLQTEIISFLYFVPEPFVVVINEVMADPNPEVNLPNYEYIEIKNTTEFGIDLSGWKFKVGSSERTFPDYIIDSAKYVTLCLSTAAEFLDDYGTVIDFSSFPVITNSGTSVVIFDENDIVIDSIKFNIDWYNNPEKEDGGWSIERIDPLNICSGITNWKASENANGGTPGTENSVFASNIDVESPMLSKLEVLSDTQMRLLFNEPIEQISSTDISNFLVSNSIGNPSSSVLSSNSTELILNFATSFTDGVHLVLTVQNIEDYCGNAITITNIDFVYYQTKPFDIVINEVFADPDPVFGLPEFEYVEIYNTTKYEIDFSDWRLKVGTTFKDFPEYILDSSAYLILCSSEEENYLNTYGTVLGFSSFPAITNSGAPIVIFGENDVVIDSINFIIDWYKDTEKEDGGWSIERIDPLNTCSGITNWKASEDANGGTPGTENSVFAYNIDTEAPVIDEIEILSNNQLKLLFNEPVEQITAENYLNYLLSGLLGNPSSVVLSENSLEVILSFANSFPEGDNLTLSVQNIEDFCGNILTVENINFVYYSVKQFDVVINELMANPDEEVGLPEYEYIEIYNTTNYEIDLSGWKLKTGTTFKDFPDYVLDSLEYLILCSIDAQQYLNSYGNVLEFSSFSTLTNSGTSIAIYSDNDIVIDSINFNESWYHDSDKKDGGWSIERIDPLNTCSSITNWNASIDQKGGTPGTENSVFASNMDTEVPQILDIEIVSNNQLKIYFDEPITEESLIEKTNYTINNGVGNSLSALASENLMEVDLLFLNSFPEEKELILSIENLSDECGNTISLSGYNFVYYVVKVNDIVFNEIMADPEPALTLPEFEYLEIYNVTEFDISLKDWTLTAGSTSRTISSETIKAGEYLILCSNDAAIELETYGNTLPVSGFPSLANSGQTLILRNAKNEIISQVSYNDDWYQDDYKAEGGWTLEQIDPMNPCGGTNNWIASESETGGTPAQENSVYTNNPDIEAPELLRITMIDDYNIQLFFNETIDSISAMQTDNYMVDNGVGNPISIDLIGYNYLSLVLGFENAFQTNTIYNLEITEGIFDCAGNEIYDKNTAQFAIPSLVEENDLVINEVLFNPLPDGFDFVEIYNRSDKTIDLKDILIASFNIDKGEYSDIEQVTFEGYLIFPNTFVVLTENQESVKQQYYTPNSDAFINMDLPSFNDDNGRVILLNETLDIIEYLSYDDDMHFDLLAITEGVSLERINYDRPSDDKTNWHSASELVGFATPAYENSQFMELENIEDEVKIEPEVFSPDNDGFEDVANISFTFNEPGYVANIKIFDSKGRLIRYLTNNKLLGIDGIISWDGLDDKNQKAPVGIYVIFIEAFDLEGNVKQYKKSVVVAAMW